MSHATLPVPSGRLPEFLQESHDGKARSGSYGSIVYYLAEVTN